MKDKFIECGKIVSTQGIHGEVRIQPWSDTPDFLCAFKELYTLSGTQKYNIVSSRVSGNVIIVKLEGVDSIEAAQTLRNHVVYVERKKIKLEKGSYLVSDILGLSVTDAETGKCYGTLCDVTPTGSRDVYHIKTESGKELLFPAIPDVIKKTDIENGIMEIVPLKGLFEDEN